MAINHINLSKIRVYIDATWFDGLDVTDRIVLNIETSEDIRAAISSNMNYVCSEVLANEIRFGSTGENALTTDLVNEADTRIDLLKD